MCWIKDELTLVAALWKKLEDSPFPSLKSQYNMNLLAFMEKDMDPIFYFKEATINEYTNITLFYYDNL